MATIASLNQLKNEWNLVISQANYTQILDIDSQTKANSTVQSCQDIQKVILSLDLRFLTNLLETGRFENICMEDIAKRDDILRCKCPLLCQVLCVNDVTKPKQASKGSDAKSKPLYKLKVTTGKLNFNVLCLEYAGALETLAPGTKLLIKGPHFTMMEGLVLLYNEQFSILGGRVPDLYEPWIAQQSSYKFRMQRDNKRTGAPKFEKLNADTHGLTNNQSATSTSLETKLLNDHRHHPSPNKTKGNTSTKPKDKSEKKTTCTQGPKPKQPLIKTTKGCKRD
ncbi:bifunctional RecQ mediated genome instability protein [Babesia duncani]|uniref:Bifunctional RecQ mediated genome instability protein n=1 Tax=Babesia duncani TaxID=323732 RepID=A0AAD9UMF8_9APIC|nr:bifunctional RecQ mediated genome instability protein [Babesia duncani]KAK2196230.1 bifunctional RecQ mediated genome instability protein [Babesia duncani]